MTNIIKEFTPKSGGEKDMVTLDQALNIIQTKVDFDTVVTEIAQMTSNVCTYDDLVYYVRESVDNEEWLIVSHLSKALSDNWCDFYNYERCMGTLEEPTPITDMDDINDIICGFDEDELAELLDRLGVAYDL